MTLVDDAPGDLVASALHHVADCVLVLDERAAIQGLNRAAERWLGLPAAMVVGEVLVDLADRSEVIRANRRLFADTPQLLGHLLAADVPLADDEMTVFTADGRLRTISSRVTPYLEDGRPRVVWSFRYLDGQRTTFRASSIAMARLARDGRFMQANPAMERLTGRPEALLAGTAMTDLASGADRLAWQEAIDQEAPTGGQEVVTEQEVLRPDGTSVWTRCTVSVVPGDHPWETFLLVVLEDVSARRAAEDVVARNAADHEVLARLATAVLVAQDETQMIDACAHLLREGTGLTELVLQDGTPRSGPERAATAGSEFEVPVPGQGQGPEARLLLRFPPGCLVPDARGRLLAEATATMLSAGLARLRAEVALLHQVLHDPLTGLANRRLLLERLDAALARRSARRQPVTVVFVDLDGFKHVNDEHGHAVGDELLVHFAERLRRVSRRSDTVCRWGGDEFVLLCETLADPPETAALAQRVRAEAARPFDLSVGEVVVAASVGAVASGPGSTAADLLRRADAAMYLSKRAARRNAM